MPIPNDYKSVVHQLAEATQEERVKWKSDGHVISVRVEDATFSVWNGVDDDTDTEFVSFGLGDARNKTVDTWAVDAGEHDFEMMKAFFKNARRQALGIPQRLRTLEAALATKGVIGGPTAPDDPDDGLPF